MRCRDVQMPRMVLLTMWLQEDKALMDKYGLERWAVKKDDLQLGWLDRFFFCRKVGLQRLVGWRSLR